METYVRLIVSSSLPTYLLAYLPTYLLTYVLILVVLQLYTGMLVSCVDNRFDFWLLLFQNMSFAGNK